MSGSSRHTGNVSRDRDADEIERPIRLREGVRVPRVPHRRIPSLSDIGRRRQDVHFNVGRALGHLDTSTAVDASTGDGFAPGGIGG